MRCYEYLYVSVMPFINKILLNNITFHYLSFVLFINMKMENSFRKFIQFKTHL